MNMHGFMTPVSLSDEEDLRATRTERLKAWLWRHRVFGLVVVLPSLILSFYLFAIASDQYESEAHFLVRSQNVSAAPSSGVSAALSFMTGTPASSSSEALSVSDYLTSHDAVAALRAQDDLVGKFHRSDIDVFSRLSTGDPTPEKLLKYYRKQVKVTFSTETGITSLVVHSFRPEDSYELVRKLMTLGEQRVNMLNRRSYGDAMATARSQLAEAEDALAVSQSRLTQYRQVRGDINPQASGQAQITLVATLTSQLAAAQAQLNSMGTMIGRTSPQYEALAARVRAIQGQVAAQSSKLTGGDTTIAAKMGGYDELSLRQQFLAKRYEAAAAALDRARDQAQRQQLYLVRVVEPNMAVKALYPQRWQILGTTVIALLLAYSIGWLIVAGVREHEA